MFDSPAFVTDGSNMDAELFRRAFGTLLSPAGGVVTPGDLAVSQQISPNMSVQVGVGTAWIPGTTTPTQGPYMSHNNAAVTQVINASDPSLPRIDTILAQVVDVAYAGAAKTCGVGYVAGTPTSGATLVNLTGKGAVPASSLVLAYVLVPNAAASIVTADIANVARLLSTAQSGWTGLPLSTNWNAVSIVPEWRLVGDVVSFLGACSNNTGGASTAPFTTLPAQIRPAATVYGNFPVLLGGAVNFYLQSSGVLVTGSVANNAQISLTGFSYPLSY